MKKSALTGLVAVLLVALTACGGSDDKKKKDDDAGPTAAEVVTNFADSFAADAAGALDEEEAQCFASTFVDEAGVDRLLSAKLVDKKGEITQEKAVFDEKLASGFADAFLGCVDFAQKQAEVIAAADKKIDEKKLAACIAEALPDDLVSRFIVSSHLASKDFETLRAQSAAKMEGCRKKSLAR